MAGDFDIGPADYYADNGGNMNGKGDSPRPKSVTSQTYADNWRRTFCPAFDALNDVMTCDTLGPNGSCLACGKGGETLGDPEE